LGKLAMASGFRIGVDLGGTKIEAAAIDRQGATHARCRVATPTEDYAGTIAAVAGLVHGIEAELGSGMPVGVGIPGTLVESTGLVKNANSTWLIGRPLGRDLEAALRRPVRLANDANCFALSEASDGAAAGSGNVFGVILGTGVGGGVVIGGRIIVGANAITGEWGHNPGRAPTSCPGRSAIAAARAASRRSCRDPVSPPTIGAMAAVTSTGRASPRALLPETNPAARRSIAMPNGSRARWRAS
jgi:predicted NBD/HSP70 family sugar kinase